MLAKFKELLKRFLPPPVHTFHRAIERVLSAIDSSKRNSLREHKQLEQAMAEQLKALSEENTALRKTVNDHMLQMQKLLAEREQQHDELMVQKEALLLALDNDAQTRRQEHEKLAAVIERAGRQALESSRYASEAVWAEIFNNTITDSIWLRNKTFSPGRWAVGYPYLYVMYRVLNETHPKRILELGLGQSTRMIGQYAAAFDDVEHIVVEHDQEWIDFFCNDFELSGRTQIVKLDREMVPYKEAEAVRAFKGFKETFEGQKFDFISIDAPLGGDMKQYARIDVLNLLPDCLSEDFVIMIDDAGRLGEMHAVDEMVKRLNDYGVSVVKGRYCGAKDMILFCDRKNSFLTTM